MRLRHLLLTVMLISISCVNKMEGTQEPLPESDYVRLSFIACGKVVSSQLFAFIDSHDKTENIGYTWERVTEDSEDVNKLSLIISDGANVLQSYASDSTSTPCPYTGLLVEPFLEDPSYAEVQSARVYSQSDLSNAVTCFAVSGWDHLSECEGRYSYGFEMPAIFTQTKNQDPSFMKEYAYMYAEVPFHDTQTLLNFNHIPAYFRFVIENESPTPTLLKNVSMFLSDSTDVGNQMVASAKATALIDLSMDNIELSYDVDGYEKVVTVFDGNDVKLSVGENYTAYSMALPLASDEAFRNKTLNFQVQSDSGIINYQLSGEEFAADNAGVFNWIGGKTYTVHISIGGDAGVTGKVTTGNCIEVFADVSGMYTLKYVNADGKPLEEYADICTLTVDNIATYEDFIDVNIAPMDASAIGVFDTEMNCLSSISISCFKPEFSAPLYTFGVLSDIHMSAYNAFMCQEKFQSALTFFNENNVDFICICGDISEAGTIEEYAIYKQIITSCSPDTPVYTTTGNHDAMSVGINHADWVEYTGSEVVFDFSMPLPDGRKDHFLFFGMSYWSQTGAYAEEHLKWLEGKLAEYKDERCFIITHMFFPDMAGNMNEIYPSSNWLAGALLERLQTMCNNNPNAIWLSGHSHWKWAMQKFDPKANVYRIYNDDRPSSGWCVHIPSCAKPIESDGQSREARPKESEGAVFKVYEDYVDISGLDLINRKYLPIAIYRLDTSLY